jgi:hypothetical protein
MSDGEERNLKTSACREAYVVLNKLISRMTI